MSLAITSLIVIAFTLPLMFLVRQQAVDRAQINAEHAAETIAGLVALAAPGSEALTAAAFGAAIGDPPDGVWLILPGGERLGDPPGEFSAVEASARTGAPAAGYNQDGHWEVGIPVQTTRGIIAVVASATVADLHQGVATAWIVLGILGLLVIAAAVGLSMRLGRELVRPVGDIAAVATRLGEGDLTARAHGDGPPELAAVAAALNGLAERLGDLIKAERESLADLSHRLRTPLTSLRLQSEGLTKPDERELLTGAVDRMQDAVDGMILEVRRGKTTVPAVDLSEVVSKRMEFWKVLCEEQEREVFQAVTAGPLLVRAGSDELGSAFDGLIGNVLSHTPPGSAFEVRLKEEDGRAVLIVGDAGPGFHPGVDPTKRGVSGAGSTGLGLDIARRVAEATGGSLHLGRSPLGGAQVEIRLGLMS